MKGAFLNEAHAWASTGENKILHVLLMKAAQ